MSDRDPATQYLIDQIEILSAKVTLWVHGVHPLSESEYRLFLDIAEWYHEKGQYTAERRRHLAHEHDFRIQCTCGALPIRQEPVDFEMPDPVQTRD